jgi:hypothetical protein
LGNGAENEEGHNHRQQDKTREGTVRERFFTTGEPRGEWQKECHGEGGFPNGNEKEPGRFKMSGPDCFFGSDSKGKQRRADDVFANLFRIEQCVDVPGEAEQQRDGGREEQVRFQQLAPAPQRNHPYSRNERYQQKHGGAFDEKPQSESQGGYPAPRTRVRG